MVENQMISQLKTVNDTCGHAAGDEALLTVARRLLEQVRETDVVGRLGGDELGVILAQADKGAAWEKAELLADAIQIAPFDWGGQGNSTRRRLRRSHLPARRRCQQGISRGRSRDVCKKTGDENGASES